MPNTSPTLPPVKAIKRGAAARAPRRHHIHHGAVERAPEKPKPSLLAVSWPVVIGFVLAFFAPQLRDAVAAVGPWATRLVFPFVLLAGRREFGFSEELAANLPQFILILQFPLEGLLTTFNLRERVRLGLAVGQLVFLHCLGAFVLWLLAQQVTAH